MDNLAFFSPRASTPARSEPKSAEPDSSEELAAWLKEVARRPWVSKPQGSEPPLRTPACTAEIRATLPDEPKGWHGIENVRDLVGLAALTAGWLQYYFLDAMVQIHSLPKVVVFVPLGVA